MCAVGGILGVLYTVPLRRALVTESDLPYPEGVAAAEVLIVGAGGRAAARAGGALGPSASAVAENEAGLLAVVVGSLVSAGFAVIVATRLFIDEAAVYFRIGPAATGIAHPFRLRSWGPGISSDFPSDSRCCSDSSSHGAAAVPIITALHPWTGDAAATAIPIWAHKVRFIGAGAIGISAIGRSRSWRCRSIAASSRRWPRHDASPRVRATRCRARARYPDRHRRHHLRHVPRTARGLVRSVSLRRRARQPRRSAHARRDRLRRDRGLSRRTACGYMAGLIGSSNSPVSGLAILAVIGASLLLEALGRGAGPAVAPTLVAYALFVTAVVLCVATIANDNLQDLKTGQLVDATPWRQQVALIIGVIMGAIVIPPVLGLLAQAYGFAGAPSIHGATNAQPLPAPQATLISALAKGVIEGQIDWGLIGIGALVGAGIIALDALMRAAGRVALPPLAVGIGIYLPAGTVLPVVLGALLGWAYDRHVARGPNAAAAKRIGVLLASGLIVGESLFGVALAGVIVATGRGTPLSAVSDSFAPYANVLGTIAFIAVAGALYVGIERLARRAG